MPAGVARADRDLVRKGTPGVSTNGVTANFVFFLTEVLFGYRSVKICQQKCKCCTFSPKLSKKKKCSNPISVDPICPQPNLARSRPDAPNEHWSIRPIVKLRISKFGV